MNPTKGVPVKIKIMPNMFTKPIAAPALPGNNAAALLNKPEYGKPVPMPKSKMAKKSTAIILEKNANKKQPAVFNNKLMINNFLTPKTVTNFPPNGLLTKPNNNTSEAIKLITHLLPKEKFSFNKVVIQVPITITNPNEAI